MSLVQQLQQQHEDLEASQNSPYLSYMENYYFGKPKNYVSVIMGAGIPKAERDHLIAHLRVRLAGKHAEARRARRVQFEVFVKDPAAQRAQTRRFEYTKRTDNGEILKRSRKNGRFVKLSGRERQVLKRNATK